MAENAVMEKAGEIFGKKYGGIPFPVILIGVGVTAFAIRKLIKGQQASKTVDSQPVDPNGYVVDASGNKFASAYTGAGGGVTPFGAGSLTSAASTGIAAITPVTETNNEGWFRRASEKLSGAGMWDPVFIQTALMKYISGAPLNQRELAVANQAVKMEGQPPINVNPGESQIVDTTSPTGFVQNIGTGDVYQTFSDGSLRILPGGNALITAPGYSKPVYGWWPAFDAIVQGDRGKYVDSTGNVRVEKRASNDPIFTNVVS